LALSQLALGLFVNAQNQVVAVVDAKTLKSNANNMRAYNNLFGQFQRTKIRQNNYKKVKLSPLNLTLVGTVFKAKNALAIIKNGSDKAKILLYALILLAFDLSVLASTTATTWFCALTNKPNANCAQT
jgi:hypothetical protein